ncbi:SH2 domain-containing protein 1A-like isoform X2 [Sardina pilchardus]|uniref:SH2 domain-containing protein 1A-like isoform X2 n=1 Tax=Sardina pilchardus TaxID=27697 RepID=UPI002E0E8AD8
MLLQCSVNTNLLKGVLMESIYFGKISKEVTERLLERYGKDGSYLLRDSESVAGALCFCVRKAPFVHTYRIEKSQHGWAVEHAWLVFIPGSHTTRLQQSHSPAELCHATAAWLHEALPLI